MLYQLSYAHRRSKHQCLCGFQHFFCFATERWYTIWYANYLGYACRVYHLLVPPSTTLCLQCFLEFIHRCPFHAAFNLDVAFSRDTNISMTQDSLYIGIGGTKGVQIRRKPAPESVPPAPFYARLLQRRSHNAVCQIVQVERSS